MFCKKSNKEEVQLQVRLTFIVKQLTEFNQRKYLVTKKSFSLTWFSFKLSTEGYEARYHTLIWNKVASFIKISTKLHTEATVIFCQITKIKFHDT